MNEIDVQSNYFAISAYFASLVAVTGTLWKLLDRIEKIVSSDARESLANWLMKVDLERSANRLVASFEAAFDSIFGERHFTWRCFFLSCMASVISLVIVTLVWAVIRPEEAKAFLLEPDMPHWLTLGIFAGINLIPDYLSLLESRLVIRRMAKVTSHWGTLLWLVADALLTVSIVVAAFVVVYVPVVAYINADFFLNVLYDLPDVVTFAFTFHSFDRGDINPGLFVYTTFFTSVWVWLYAVASILIKLGGWLGMFSLRLRKFLDIQHKPFLAVGTVMVSLVTVVYLIASPFVFL